MEIDFIKLFFFLIILFGGRAFIRLYRQYYWYLRSARYNYTFFEWLRKVRFVKE